MLFVSSHCILGRTCFADNIVAGIIKFKKSTDCCIVDMIIIFGM